MKNYQEEQYQLFEKIEKQFKENRNAVQIVEPVSDYSRDDRISLTSVVFAPNKIVKVIQDKIIELFGGIDKSQYFYLPESFHLTIQSIRTASKPLLFNNEDIEKVRSVFREIIPQHNKFCFDLKGLFETPTSFSVRGYSNESLKNLILDLRKGIIDAGVPDNKKYGSDSVFFGNITVCRYTREPNNSFKRKIKELKNIEIGSMNIEKISLITTNTVTHPTKTKIIDEFYLN